MNAFYDNVLDYVVVFGLSFTLSVILAVTRAGRALSDLSAVQSAHSRPTSRLGGVAIACSVVVGGFLWFTSRQLSHNYLLFLATCSPVFVAGVLEDIGLRVGSALRLFAAALSGAFFVAVFGQWLPRLDVGPLDVLMTYPSIAIPFTLFACSGVAHSINLIDGINGLSAIITLGISSALIAVASRVGLTSYVEALTLLMVAISGFLVVNFPFGRLFLGDGGAYLLGHVIVWTAVSIVWNSEQVSAFAILLIFFWPIADTLLAIFRRFASGRKIMRPDRLHFHQLVMRAIEISALGGGRRSLANPLASVVITPMALAPMVLGVMFWDQKEAATWSAGFLFILFFTTYFAGLRLSKSVRRKLG